MRRLITSVTFLTVIVCARAEPTPAAVMEAIRNDHLAQLREMKAKGIDLNAPGERGTTPLIYAAAFGSIDAMRLLIGYGADVNAKNALGATALMWGIYDLDKTRLLVSKGADVNARFKTGRTPILMAAFYTGSEPVVRLLLAHGADARAEDQFGFNLLQAACAANDIAVAKIALEKGVPVDPFDKMAGNNPIQAAAALGNVELTRLLLAHHANVNAVSPAPSFKVKNGVVKLGNLTALQLAAAYGPAEEVKLLLDAGAKVDAKDARGMTALHFAVSSEVQDPEIVRLLLARGADPGVKMETGETARDWSAKFAYREVLEAIGVKSNQDPGVSAARIADRTVGDVRGPAQKSFTLLETSAASFFKEGACSSCHAQNITGIATGIARAHGLHVDEALASERVQMVKAQWLPQTDMLLARYDTPGSMDTNNYALFDLAGLGYRADRMTDAIVRNTAGLQLADGSWAAGGIARVPIEDSNIARTAMAIRTMQLFGPPACRAEFEQRIANARAWLLSAKARYQEDRNWLLLGLKWSGAPEASIRGAKEAILKTQRADGGWAQNSNLPSDAYATGQALYALHESGALSTSDPAYQRGVAYLLETQAADGSWHVRSRAVKFQPYFQSGFPYEHDQWISNMGTGWATIALMQAIEKPNQLARK